MAKKKVAKKSSKNPAWKQFEEYVANLYSEFGCQDVATDINIEGNQIDVFGNMPNCDGTYLRAIISCKNYNSRVGVGAVREWYCVFRALFDVGKADIGLIVSSKGFTQDAQALARKVGIKLVSIENLRWAGIDFRPYLNASISQFMSEPVFSRNCYVPMKVRFDGTKTVVPVNDALYRFLEGNSETKRLFLLLGDYGAGKTTVCKYLFQTLSREFLKRRESVRVPIYINLRDYPEHLNIQSMITNLLLNEYRSRCPGFLAIERLLMEGRIVIFLDAFDEMASRSDYQTTLRNFHSIRSLLVGKAKVILTCRTHYFKDQEEIHDAYSGTELYRVSVEHGYRIAYLQGFTQKEIKAYVRAVCLDNWERYYNMIEETYNLKAIAERPILLDMITEVLPRLIDKEQEITSTRLYQLYTRFWLARDDWRTNLSSTERERFTIAFAEAMYREKKDKFSWNQVKAAISSRWPQSTRKELEYYEHDIRTCSFIRRVPDTNYYEFIHQSFLEFFVSSYLYESIISHNPSPFVFVRHTPQVLSFLAQCMPTEQVTTTLAKWVQTIKDVNLLSNCLNVLTQWIEKLEGYSFKYMRLDGIDMRNFIFSSVLFEGVDLRSIRFFFCKMYECDFAKSKLKNCIFGACRFVKTIFTDCELTDCLLNFFKTESVKFVRGKLLNCDISDSRLNGVTFTETYLDENTWSFKSLNGVTFNGVTFGSNAHSIEKVLLTSGRRKWRTPPVFRDVLGLNKNTSKLLLDHGAQVVKMKKKT